MSLSNIEWTDRTWNPVTGCTKVSQGCKHCYAEGVAHRFFARQYPQVPVGPTLPDGGPTAWRDRRFTDVQTHEDRLLEPLKWKKPARVFVNSMSDLFHEDVPFEFVGNVMDTIVTAKQHTFQVLTKRPERMRYFFGEIGRSEKLTPPPNLWLGVSVEDQATADQRIPVLLDTPAAVRFVSAEPLLSGIDLSEFLSYDPVHSSRRSSRLWVICGGESGPGARPFNIAWARSVVEQCRDARVAVFVKQLGAAPVQTCSRCERQIGMVPGGMADVCGDAHEALRQEMLRIRSRKGGDPAEWPEDLRVREFPR